ncbi:MAG: peptidoglycan bridge formation glycyltransferase FemA/FemB family protein [Nitrososphaeria archaeon]
MPLEIVEKHLLFKIKQIWFAEVPYVDRDCSLLIFYDCKNKVDLQGFERHNYFTSVIDLNQDLENIWGRFNKTTRNEIRRAYKEGLEIRINKDFDEFYKLYMRFKQKKGLKTRGPSLTTIKRYGVLFTALKDGEILTGQVYYTDGQTMRWIIGASKRLEISGRQKVLISYANRLLIWEAIQYAKRKRIAEFDLGGYYMGSTPDEEKEKINFFKRGFGGEIVCRYRYLKFNSPFMYMLNRVKGFFVVNKK